MQLPSGIINLLIIIFALFYFISFAVNFISFLLNEQTDMFFFSGSTLTVLLVFGRNKAHENISVCFSTPSLLILISLLFKISAMF